jgi:hypothetical protein
MVAILVKDQALVGSDHPFDQGKVGNDQPLEGSTISRGRILPMRLCRMAISARGWKSSPVGTLSSAEWPVLTG